MPRRARIKGEFLTYHVIIRKNERKNIFLSDEDKARFIDTLKRMKDKYNYILEAYCLMDNHVHLLINDNGNDISKILKSISISYVHYFNYVLEFEPMSEILDIEEDKYLYKKENSDYIDSFEAALIIVQQELEIVHKNIEQLNKDKGLRLELIKRLRKNSNLSLKEIGQICGGISQSMVCKILKQ